MNIRRTAKFLLLSLSLICGSVTAQAVVPTNEWVSFWGDTIKNSGYPVTVGSVVRAYDPQGILCGEFTVTTAGKYGLMAVYRDDALTTPDEGAQPGDTIRFTINGVPAVVLGPGAPVWTANGAVIKLNMKIGIDPVPPPAPVAYSAYNILATQFSAQWSYVSTATGYRLDVAPDSVFANYIPGYQDKDVGTSTSWTVTGLQPSTKYFYRIRAMNIAGTGPNSNVISVVTVDLAPPIAPLLLSPPNGATGVSITPTLIWNASSGATSYRVQVSTNLNFSTTIVDRDRIQITSCSVNGLDTNKAYYWRVNATNSAGTSPWSNSWSFTSAAAAKPPDPPTLVFPASGSINVSVTPTLKWNASAGATAYHLQVASDPNFAVVVLSDSTILAPSKQVGQLSDNTTYFWRVRAKNSAGTSTWSSGWSFATEKLPDLIVSQVQTPPIAYSGQTFKASWVVSNNGKAGTNAPVWNDRVFLSQDTVLDLQSATYLGSFENVSFLNPQESYSNSGTFTLPQGGTGRYYVFVVADFNNNLRESNKKNNTGRNTLPLQVNLTPPPDLQVVSLVAPYNAFSGKDIRVSWSVQNLGTGPTVVGSWSDAIYLTQDSVLNVSTAKRLGVFSHNGILAPDSGYSSSATVTMPQAIFGKYYVFVFTDIGNQVYEYVWKSNNARHNDSLIVTLSPPPDLTVTKLTIPSMANSGQPINVQWTVQNQGPGAPFESGWSDCLYLSTTAALNTDSAIVLGTFTHLGTLARDSSYTVQASVTIPNGISGARYIFAKTDWKNQVFEYLYKGNNVRRSDATIQINLTPWPDFRVASIQTPNSGTAGKQIAVSWTVMNAGSGATPSPNYWIDRIYVSSTPTWDASNAVRLTDVSCTQTLAPSASYAQTASVTLPTSLSGTYYLYVYTDANNAVYEYTNEGNNVGRSGALSVQPYPPVDLAVTGLSTPISGSSGQPVIIQWVVTNIGSGKTLVSSWNDALYLSPDTVLNPNTSILLTNLAHSGALDAAGSYTRNQSLVLPNGLSGKYYLIAITDVDGLVNDVKPGNNTRRTLVPISIALTPSPDLRVTAVSAPSQIQSGQPITVHWTVQNKGVGVTPGQSWYDAIYLSTDSLPGNTAARLGTYTRNGALTPSSSYSDSLEVNIPMYASGNYYVIVQTDSRNDIYEQNGEDNNTRAMPIAVTLPPPADLVVTSISMPDSAMPGDLVTVTWTIRNQGVNPAVGWMRDAVYFSSETTWDVSNPLLGILSRYINLAPGASFKVSMKVNLGKTYLADPEGNITAEMPGVTPGRYHAIVRTDIRRNIRESDYGNNTLSSVATMNVSIPALQLGVPVTGMLAQGQMRYYRLDVAANLDMRVSLTSNAAGSSNEVYVSYGRTPTLADFDASGAVPFSSNQKAFIPSTKAGSYYILARAQSLPVDGTLELFSLTAEALPFSILSVTPNVGGIGGRLTTVVTGAGFRDSTKVFLRITPDSLMPATVLRHDNSMQVTARFDLGGVAPAKYDVVVTNSRNESSSLSQGLSVEPAITNQILKQVSGPDLIRGGSDAVFDILIGNQNNNDADYVALTVIFPSNQRLEIQTSDFFGRPVPAEFFSRLDHPMAGIRMGGVAAINALAKNVSVGQTLRARLRFFRVSGGHLPFLVYAYAVTKDHLIYCELATITIVRERLLSGDASTVPPQLRSLLQPDSSLGIFLSSLYQSGLVGDGPITMPTMPLRFDPTVRSSIPTLQPKSAVSRFLSENPADCESIFDYLSAGIQGESYFFSLWATVPMVYGFFMGGEIIAGVAGGLLILAPMGLYIYDAYHWYTGKPRIEDCDTYSELAHFYGAALGGWEHALADGAIWAAKLFKDRFCKLIVVSCDPNEIAGPNGSGDERWIARNLSLPYTVHFENDPKAATASAQTVTIAQHLDTTIDARSFRLGSFGVGNSVFDVPDERSYYTQRLDMRDSLGLYVDLNAGIDVTTNQITWTFTSIDPATGQKPTNPLAGFLPLNDSLHHGEGFVSYTIRPKSTAHTRDVVNAKARIVFDVNPPLDTPPIFNTIDAVPPSSHVRPLPNATRDSTFTVSWYGNDDSTGSGIQSYSIYVSGNDSAFVPWISNTSDTSAVFSGTRGTRYRFYSLATDNAGNAEPAKNAGDTYTLITGVANEKNGLPSEFALEQNYPNPFNPSTTLQYGVPVTSRVRLKIYNVLGQLVADLVNGEQVAGWYRIRWNANVSTGIYFYRIEAVSTTDPNNRFVQVKKMLLLK